MVCGEMELNEKSEFMEDNLKMKVIAVNGSPIKNWNTAKMGSRCADRTGGHAILLYLSIYEL